MQTKQPMTMRYQFILSITILIFTIACEPKTPAVVEYDPRRDLSEELSGAVIWYQNSAEMRMSYYQAYNHGKLLLKSKLASADSKQPKAVVLDLDETVLDNSPYEGMLIQKGITFSSNTWKEWVAMGSAELLPGAQDFLNFADSAGVEIFYISNRTVDGLGSTLENLNRYNLPNADSAHVLLKEDTSDKTARRNIVNENYEIILFLGDNLTDYSQMYADRNEKMAKDLVDENKMELLNNFVMFPNPMYGEWESAIYRNDWSIADSTKLRMRRESVTGY